MLVIANVCEGSGKQIAGNLDRQLGISIVALCLSRPDSANSACAESTGERKKTRTTIYWGEDI